MGESQTLLSVRIIRSVVSVYDFVTLPFYYLCMQPWKVRQLVNRERSKRIDERTWVNVDNDSKKATFNTNNLKTLDELFRQSVKSYGPKNALGYRKILSVEYEPRSEGKKVSKYILDDKYTWKTYSDIEKIVLDLSSGLINMCNDTLRCNDGTTKVMIAADTCMQWFLLAHACFRINCILATAYTTLDDDAMLHIMNETEVKAIVVSQKIAKRLYKLLPMANLIDTVIILDEPLPGEKDVAIELRSYTYNGDKRVRLVDYNELRASGHSQPQVNTDAPKTDDVAVLMYTSGSTGLAKGVMLAHKNIVYTALSFSGPGDICSDDRYIAYLPLGHVLEMAAECIFLRNGTTIGYSSPQTLTDRSPLIKRGQQGDASIIKPTILGTVPMVLDRVKRTIQSAVKERGPFLEQLVEFVQDYKSYWYDQCYTTPIMNRLICRQFSMVLGGELRVACSGGAALPTDTQRYLCQVMNLPVLQGYGLTETSAAASFCDLWEHRVSVVGAPYPFVHIRLEDWSDYSVKDKPYPRGEIVIGGQPVSIGYYKQPQLTDEAYYVDEKTGIRYFRTGDIGQIVDNDVLQVIDRKKDIVKPLSGEYISLVQSESVMKKSPIIDNICVYCGPTTNYLVAFIVPNPGELRSFVKQLVRNGQLSVDSLQSNANGVAVSAANGDGNRKASDSGDDKDSNDLIAQVDSVSLGELCSNELIINKVLDTLKEIGLKNNLRRNHIPSRIMLVRDEWTPDSGLITASFKLRRREIEKFYSEEIKRMYESLP